jgi:asparagine synthase (glutamine-hydrolysing)
MFGAVIEALDPELARMPLVSGLSPSELARATTATRVRQGAQFARRISRKVRQRLSPGTDTPPAGAASLSRQVVSWWTSNPTILEPLARNPWLDTAAVEAVAEGRRMPSASSVGLIADLLVIASSLDAAQPVALAE